MKKSEIIQIAITILGILVMIRTLEALSVQMSSLFSYSKALDVPDYWLAIFVGMFLLMLLIGYFIIKHSSYFAKKIVKEDTNFVKPIDLSKRDIISIAIVIISLYHLIFYFTGFVSTLYSLFMAFTSDFQYFNVMFPDQIWRVLQYILVVIVFLKANSISKWIEHKIFGQEKSDSNTVA